MGTEYDDEDLSGYMSDTPLDPRPRYPPRKQNLFDATIVLRNLPKVPQAKLEKLTKVLTKLMNKVGPLSEVGIHMPFDEAKGSSLGFAFVEFASPDNAERAIDVFQGYQM